MLGPPAFWDYSTGSPPRGAEQEQVGQGQSQGPRQGGAPNGALAHQGLSWKACTWHSEGMAPQPAPLGTAARWMMALYFCPQAPGPGTCLTQCPENPWASGREQRQLLQMFPLLRPGNVLSHMLPPILPP